MKPIFSKEKQLLNLPDMVDDERKVSYIIHPQQGYYSVGYDNISDIYIYVELDRTLWAAVFKQTHLHARVSLAGCTIGYADEPDDYTEVA